MQNPKNTKNSSKNIQQAFRQFYKYGSLSKQQNELHKISQSKETLVQKNSIHRSTMLEKDPYKKKIVSKKHANLRTFNFQDIVSSKMYTQNSSLCGSIQKQHRNSTINTISKERLKMSSHFSSFHELSSHKQCNKSISIFCGQNDKKTIKLKNVGSKKDMQKLLSRTKSVLEGYMNEKQKWFTQKQQYQAKIKNLTIELGILKEKITLSDKDFHMKRTQELLTK